jgi:hypothetical protein
LVDDKIKKHAEDSCDNIYVSYKSQRTTFWSLLSVIVVLWLAMVSWGFVQSTDLAEIRAGVGENKRNFEYIRGRLDDIYIEVQNDRRK